MIRLLYSNTGYVWQYSTSHVFQLQAIFSANSHPMNLSLDFQAANHLQLLNQEYWFDATAGLFLSERSSAFYRREYCLTALPLLLKHLVGSLLPQFNIFLTEVKKCDAFTGHSSSKPYSSFTVNTLNPWNNILCVVASWPTVDFHVGIFSLDIIFCFLSEFLRLLFLSLTVVVLENRSVVVKQLFLK